MVRLRLAEKVGIVRVSSNRIIPFQPSPGMTAVAQTQFSATHFLLRQWAFGLLFLLVAHFAFKGAAYAQPIDLLEPVPGKPVAAPMEDGAAWQIGLFSSRGDCAECIWLQFDGEITVSSMEALRSALQSHGFVKHLQIQSKGGSPIAAMEMGRWLREMSIETIVADTRVDNHSARGGFGDPVAAECYSACLYLFVGGSNRFLHNESRVGVHQFFSEEDLGLGQSELISVTQSISATLRNYLTQMGVDSRVQDIAGSTSPQSIRPLTRAELDAYRVTTATEFDFLVVYGSSTHAHNKITVGFDDPFGDEAQRPPATPAICHEPRFSLTDGVHQKLGLPASEEYKEVVRLRNRFWRTVCLSYFEGPPVQSRWNVVLSALERPIYDRSSYAVGMLAFTNKMMSITWEACVEFNREDFRACQR